MNYLSSISLDNAVKLGLPEIDDRYDIWRIPIKSKKGERIGEIVIDAITTFVDSKKTTEKQLLENILLGREDISEKEDNGGSHHRDGGMLQAQRLQAFVGPQETQPRQYGTGCVIGCIE